MANTTTLTASGQVTVPRDIRKRLGLKPGDKITFSLLSDGTLVARPRNRSVADLVGLLYRAGQAMVPISEMKVDLADEG